MDQFSCLASVLSGVDKLCLSFSRDFHFRSFIHIPVSMSCNGDRFFPVSDARLNSFYDNRCTEYGSIQNRTDRPVRALPHLFQIRSEEHTSELQSRFDLVCRLLLEKKKNINIKTHKHPITQIVI